MKFVKISKTLLVCTLLVCTSIFSAFADTVEIKNGLKTTYAEKPRKVIDTVSNRYDFKWTLDKKGDWRLYIKKMNGRTVGLSNSWVSMERKVVGEDGNAVGITDYYYFDYYEKMVTGWYIDVTSEVYFLNTNPKELGRMARGWCKIGEDYYYFSKDGVLQRNIITEDGFYVDGNGKWQ